MNVSLHWLRAVAPTLEGSAEEIAERLATAGAPVEEITRLGRGLDGVVVGRVLEVRKHPDADRLVLCDVEAGGEAVQVVCGAPNVEAGGLYPMAPVGTVLPGGMEIRKAKIRGQESRGMLCSEKELELGPGQEGLMELPHGLPVGAPLVEALGLDDVRLDVEVTANRGDLLSHFGVAREAAPGGDADLRLTPVPDHEPSREALEREEGEAEAAGDAARVRIEDREGCPRYMGAVIRGVEVGPSPRWLQERLRAAGSRPINNVVDVTNFVLLELGHPLHAFDLSKLEEETIVVRRARAGETLRTLDGEERTLTPEMLCICDARRPVALAGIMGGEDSEVDSSTADVLLECALFEPRRVRSARTALDMSSDASYRFERGVDPEGAERAMGRAVDLIVATAGGRLDGPVLDAHPGPWEGRELELRLHRIRDLLGVEIPGDRVVELLEPLGFGTRSGGDGILRFSVPGWRKEDVIREVDLVEEVARSYGYDAFPEELGPFRPGTVPDHPLFALEDRIRDVLVGRGFLEAQVPAFAPESEGEVELQNPLSAEEGSLRTSLLPGLVRRVEANLARGVRHVRLFELGTCFFETEEPLPREETRLGVVATGARRPPHWSAESQAVDIWDLKGWLEELSEVVAGPGAKVRPGGPEGGILTEAEGFRLLAFDGSVRGSGGRVRAERVDAPPWADPLWALELVLPEVYEGAPTPAYEAPSPFPGVTRDFALVVPDDMPAEEVRRVVTRSGGEHLDSVEIFDLYRGEELPGGTRSVAFRLHFSSPERTLTDPEVDEAAATVLERLDEELGVRPRS